MKNEQFSALLVKYQQANKLNNTKFVKSFIDTHKPTEPAKIADVPTEEMVEFATTFIGKKAKCTDPEFTSLMAKWAASNPDREDYVPKNTVSYSGEY
jgi:hypothetical protein